MPSNTSHDDFVDGLVENIDAILAVADLFDATAVLHLVAFYVGRKYSEFGVTGDVNTIEEAISKQRLAVGIAHRLDKEKAEELDRLGVLLEVRYEHLRIEADLFESIEKAKEAVALTPASHPQLAARLCNLAKKLVSKYERTVNIADLEAALHKMEEGLRAMPVEYPNQAETLGALAKLLLIWYRETGQIAHLETALHKGKQAVRVMPSDYCIRSRTLHALATLVTIRYRQKGNMADLEAAVQMGEEALQLTPADHPDMAERLKGLAVSLQYGYDRIGKIAALNAAIQKGEESLHLTSSNHSARPGMLDALAWLLVTRYKQTGNTTDLEAAVRSGEEALHLTPADHSDMAQRLNTMAFSLQNRHECTGSVADLEEAIEKIKKAVQLMPTNDPERAVPLNNLGNMLQRYYERSGNIADLEAAICATEMAIRLIPANHPDLALYLSNFSVKLERRYARTGEMADLEAAVRKAEEAVCATPVKDSDLAGRLNNLATNLQKRYERTDKADDLEMAILKGEEALQLTPLTHPNRAGILTNLGLSIQHLYARTGKITYLEAAITKAELALQITPSDHPDLAGILSSLGNMLERRYMHLDNMADWEMAVKKMDQAVRLTQADHPDLAGMLNNLGRIQLLQPSSSSRSNALALFLRSWQSQVGIPTHRLRSARAAIDMLVRERNWVEAADLSMQAIDLLPFVNRRTLSRKDQQHSLTMFAGFSAKACSLFLQSGRSVEQAIEILEQGRGAILGLLIDERSDISSLYESYPEQATAFHRLRNELNAQADDYPAGEVGEQMRKRRTMVVRELEECIELIRRLPSHERFLLSPSATDIQQQAAAGPIIIVNVTDIRSDAIIITQDRIQFLLLERFSAEILRTWKRQRLTDFTQFDFGKKNKKYRAFLSWLWDACVQPIVALLRPCDTAHAADKPHRAWWIGTGEASAVPFHAAGNHAPGSSDNTISHMISSYTPTIKALTYSRQRLGQCQRLAPKPCIMGTVERPPRLFIATMPQTPGMAALPGVKSEASSICTATASTFSIHHLPSPSAADAKAQLATCHIFHFAGHGTANENDPSQGSLVLQRSAGAGDADQADFLSVLDTVKLHLPLAQLAYLSACSTAENQATHLADEVIHLVSGFQVAGFPHAVGSMWQSADVICANVARLFYQQICTACQGALTDGVVARALHSAMSDVRTRHWDEPLLWTQYVQFGA